MPVHDLPGVVGFVADVSDGSVLVLTEPAQPWGTSAFRLFYGAPAQMIERSITAYNQGGSGGLEITFTVGGATDTINFDAAPPADGGLGDTESTGTLDTGSGGPKTVTMRIPTPSTLAGFTFTCTGA